MTRVVVALTVLFALLFVTPTGAAHAQDRRPCVSKREFNSATFMTKSTLERRWEVVGLGRRASVPVFGSAVLYPRCGFSMKHGWYGISYLSRGRHLWAAGTVWWRDKGHHANAPARVQAID